METNNFNFFVPADIEKAVDSKGNEVMKVKGLASTGRKDSQSEFLDPSGMQLDSLKWLNWNHQDKDNPSAVIGETTKYEVNGKNELHIEGVLYPEVQKAKDAWALMKALKNSPSGNKLGLSVQGAIVKRASDDKESPLYNKIVKSRITAVAICPVPINADTYVDMIEKAYTGEKEYKYDEEVLNIAGVEDLIKGAENIVKEDTQENENEKNLSKSEVYSKIVSYLYGEDNIIVKSRSVFELVNKISEMEKTPISTETLDKAFAILDLAKSEIASPTNTIVKSDDGDEDDGDKELEKAAAAIRKGMKGKSKEDMQATFIKKGYSEKIAKAMADMEDEKEEKEEKVEKSEIAELIKSQTESLNAKFQAIGTIVKSQNETIATLSENLVKSQETIDSLKSEIEQIGNQRPAPKSMINKSYTEKFATEKEEKGTAKTFNINNRQDRTVLSSLLMRESGIEKSEQNDGRFDNELCTIAQNLEIAKSIDARGVQRLAELNIKVVTE